MKNTLKGIVLLFWISACSETAPSIIGHWEAIEINEEGRKLDVDPKEIQFRFTTEGKYLFQSTLNYREAGNYWVNGEWLYTIDTTSHQPLEKVVKIQEVTPDTLSILMEKEDKGQILVLKRISKM